MWSESLRDDFIVGTAARWLRRRVPHGAEGRRNFRLVCVDQALAKSLESQLMLGSQGMHVRWFVRASSDWDAVRLRHGRPDAVPADFCVGFVLLWSEGSAEADRNAQSLIDLPAFDVSHILADPSSFELPEEAAIRARLEDAAMAWDDGNIRARIRDHLVAAWNGLRTALRLAPRTDSSLRLVDSLSAYGAYLYHAQVPDAEWDSWPTNERAERILIRLGEALPALNLFRLPALASVLGVVTHPPSRPDWRRQRASSVGTEFWRNCSLETSTGHRTMVPSPTSSPANGQCTSRSIR